LKSRILKTLESLIDDDCKFFYSGMAMGFDILCAECVLELKKKYNDIKLICAIPFKEHGNSLSQNWRKRFFEILNHCDEFSYISDEYNKQVYQIRNKFMVDNSDFVVCWYDGKLGGTRNTLKYAAKKHRVIININLNYLDEFSNVQTVMDI
jgi:uncharacterized phage-like protein YoqJ